MAAVAAVLILAPPVVAVATQTRLHLGLVSLATRAVVGSIAANAGGTFGSGGTPDGEAGTFGGGGRGAGGDSDSEQSAFGGGGGGGGTTFGGRFQ